MRLDLRYARSSPPAVIVAGPPPDHIGGMSTVVRQMLTMDFAGRYTVALAPFTLGNGPEESLPSRFARHVRQIGLFGKCVRGTGASIVHLHTCSGFSFCQSAVDMLIAKCLGCRTVLHVHGGGFERFYLRQPRWRRILISRVLSLADRVVAVSELWQDTLQRMAPEARITVIENAVETSTAEPAARSAGRCRILLLASMDRGKGIDDLLDACRDLHTVRVQIEVVLAGPPGTAGDSAVLAAKIRARHLQDIVRYVGPVQGAKKDGLLTWADVYVQPSHYEGMPIAILEALAHGLPIIATSVGAVPEIVRHRRHGVIVPPRQPEALARAVQELAADSNSCAAMSLAAWKLAQERFSLSRLRDDLIGLYDGLILTP